MAEPSSLRPTSKDVARLAGVSQTAVSIVINGKWERRVAPHTAERIIRAAETLQYRPNLAARTLRIDRTGVILLIVPNLANPFFAYLHAGASRAAQEYGASVVICPLNAEDDETPLPLPAQALDGMIIFGRDEGRLTDLWPGLPRVRVESDPRRYPNSINSSPATGTRQAVKHLLRLGHRELAYLHAARPAWVFSTRLRSMRSTVQQVPDTRLRVVETSFDLLEARAAVVALLAEARPTALICEDDNLALAAYGAIQDAGLRVPDDISVVGYNDLPVAKVLRPALTTVRIAAAELGAAGVRALRAQLLGKEPQPETVPTELVVRNSTTHAPAP